MEDPCLPMSKQVISIPPLWSLCKSLSLLWSSSFLCRAQLPKYIFASQSVHLTPKGAASHLANSHFASHQSPSNPKSTLTLSVGKRSDVFKGLDFMRDSCTISPSEESQQISSGPEIASLLHGWFLGSCCPLTTPFGPGSSWPTSGPACWPTEILAAFQRLQLLSQWCEMHPFGGR